jgi:hypothetical protein
LSFSSYRPVGKPVFHHVVTRATFFFFSLFWIIKLAILPATMLRYYSTSESLMPSEIFSSSFRSIGSLLPQGRHSTSLQSARLQTGRLPSRLVLFSFWTDAHAI